MSLSQEKMNMKPNSGLAALREVFKAIFKSSCFCGNPEGVFYIEEGDKLGHDETCHKVISARMLGYKVKEKK